MSLAERSRDTISAPVHVIVAAADAILCKTLESELRASGWPVDELCDSPGQLQQRLAAERLGADGSVSEGSVSGRRTLVVTGPGWPGAEKLAQIALERGVPVAVWPLPRSHHAPPLTGAPLTGAPLTDAPLTAAPLTTAPLTRTSDRRLTGREREVLEWVAAGVSNKGIARRLGLSPNTVKFHIAALLDKLGAATRAEAVAAAARRGEISL